MVRDAHEASHAPRVHLASASLLTLHAAKGLAFADVFLFALEEVTLPHARSRSTARLPTRCSRPKNRPSCDRTSRTRGAHQRGAGPGCCAAPRRPRSWCGIRRPAHPGAQAGVRSASGR
ncbi:MAG: 3'-5' exonuclease [Longimicrobiales bacterium]